MSPRPGPIFDDAMKLLADDDLDAVLAVVGIGAGAQPLNVELPASARKADLLARMPDRSIVHVEYVKDAAPDLDVRMVDYRLRLRRQDREHSMNQIVLALRRISIPDRFADVDGCLVCRWSVVYVADLDPASLLASPTTAPLAALARGTANQRSDVFAAAVAGIADRVRADRRAMLLGAATTLASIVLPAARIDATLKEAAMPVPVRETPYGMLLIEEGREEGREQGREQGRRESARDDALALLRHRFGDEPRLDAVAERLAALPAAERIARILGAAVVDDLMG